MSTTSASSLDNPVLRAIKTHAQADNPSSFLALNTGNDVFTLPGVDGVAVHRRTGRHLVQFGGPFAAPDAYGELLAGLRAHAREEKLELVAVQLQRADAELYREAGFTVNQIGASWAVHLPEFTLRGTRFMQLRNKISRALRSGLVVKEVPASECEEALSTIDRAWLGSKGEHARPLEFLVGQVGGPAQELRRLFVGSIDGEPVSYISYSPVYGGRSGWMHDLSRRVPGGSPGLMEAINAAAIETFVGEGVEWLHFGFTPFTGLAEENELPGHSPSFQWLMHFLWAEGAALYPAQTQLDYKEKWAPHATLPEYVAFDGPASLAGFAHIFRACNAF
ncbi:bifunctional lysylphosphatidylglycerol flippase/synthetase MprF [Streptomyces sp. NPDC085596]|uniref:bifunctional lysylphosphatidylglycerol flippase/synthetase MprF n=1 Tax=Streptomyces sp. NPDC085596 TaxID=3365731 RepID=UPI0037D1D559